MRSAMKLLCGFLAMAGLHCGGEPLTQESKLESTLGNSESELIKGVVASRNPDRTWKKTSFVQTRKEHEAQRAARFERVRRAMEQGAEVDKQGSKLAAAPAEIGPDPDCNDPDSLWLYAMMPHEILWCCVSGPDVDAVGNMCQFDAFHAFISGTRGGWYADDGETCGGNFTPNQGSYTDGCEASWVGQYY
jgi:hypothetical protein